MKRLLQPFRQLRWKLTLSYTLTSAVAFTVVIMLIVGGGLLWLATHVSTVIAGNLSQQATQSLPYLANAATDHEPLTTWLEITAASDASQSGGQDPFHYAPLFLTMVNTQGRVLASVGPQSLPPGTLLATSLSAANAEQLNAVLSDPVKTSNAVGDEANTTLVVLVPVLNHANQLQGVLAMKILQPDPRVMFVWFFSLVFFSSAIVFILTTLVGTIFGYLIARGMTRRLKRLSLVVDKWGTGDFSARVVDRSHDEVAQITHQLNDMAEQLQNLLKTRQELATLEERNRLARDLHDSVKQQIFAVAMQIGAVKLLLKRDVDAAEVRLLKMEKLVQQAQQELTTLIRELRPVALAGKGLIAGLRELIPQWSQQTEIVANLRIVGSQLIPLTVEEALFRVAQEALSNVARHSKATLVQMTLTLSQEQVALSILDDGQGFDTAHLERRGVGLLSMQERMKALGGNVQLESTPSQGTCIIAFCNRLGVEQKDTPRVEAFEERTTV